MTDLSTITESGRYWRLASWLAVFTILYNLAEGLIAITFGISDETLTLFGFENMEGREENGRAGKRMPGSRTGGWIPDA